MGALSSPASSSVIPLQAFELADSDHPHPAVEWAEAESDIERDSVLDQKQRIAKVGFLCERPQRGRILQPSRAY
jgi:hypothetical protein